MTSVGRLTSGQSDGDVDRSPGPPVVTSAVAASAVAPVHAPPPAAPAGAGYIGALCALALIGLGAVGIHDGIAAAGWITSPRWTHAAANWVDGQRFQEWMIPVGVVAALLGLVCVVVAVKPRRVRAVALTADTSVYLDIGHIGRVAAAAARAVPGVLDARARARRRTVKIQARTTGADADAQQAAVAEAVRDALAPLASTPRIRIRTSVGGRS